MLSSLVICVFASLTIETYCQQAPPCTDNEAYGPNMNCYFTFDEWVNPSSIKKVIKDAVPFGVAHLKQYRVAFDEIDVYSTVVPDPAEDVWGYAYLTPINQYEAYFKEDSVLDGQVKEQAIAVTVEVKKQDGSIYNGQCNTFVLINQPPIQDPVPENLKPDKERLNNIANALEGAGGIPPDYIEKIKTRYTKKC